MTPSSENNGGVIEKLFTRFKHFSIVAVIASIMGSLLMFIIGSVKVVRAYDAYFLMEMAGGITLKSKAGFAIAYLMQAIDAFLIALVLMIFGYGIFILFVADEKARERGQSGGFKISSISELKRIIAEMIVIILMVKFLEIVLTNATGFTWQMLVLPVSVLLLAGAVRVLKMES